MSRSQCRDVNIVESLICILPDNVPDDALDEDLPHPDIKNAFISPRGSDFLVDLWIYNSNTHHAAQPLPGKMFNSRFRIINRGRRIATRGRVSVTFEPTQQVLADRMTIHSGDGGDIGGVKVTCHLDGGRKEESGFLDIFDGETLTIGWNCEMASAELRVPWIASGLVKSQADDNQAVRERRGLKEFSILAQDVAGKETFGFDANDRISRFNKMMGPDGNAPITLLRQSATGGLGWPLVLAIVVAVVGMIAIGITLHCYKKLYGLSWILCNKNSDDDNPREVDTVSVQSVIEPSHTGRGINRASD